MLQDPKIGQKFFHNECMRILFKRKGIVVPIIEKNGCRFIDTKFTEDDWWKNIRADLQ